MAVLFDMNGHPIKKEVLQEEQATPSLTGLRNVTLRQALTGMTPGKLLRLMNAADDGDMEGYLEMAEQLEEKDAHYASVLGTRKRAVSQLEITVEAAGDDQLDQDNAKLVRDWLGRDELEGEIFNILDAIGKGFSVTEIVWKTAADMWYPEKLKFRDPRWFEFDRNDGRTLRLRESGGAVDLPPFKYIVHTHQAKSGIPIRGGVVRPCAWMWLFKNFAIKDWVIFMEAFGQPLRLGKYAPGATAEDKKVLLKAVANLGSDAGAIVPENMNIEFPETQQKQATADLYERLAKHADEQMSKAVLGQTTTTDAISNGLAGNQAHNDVREDIARSDAKQLAATLNEQLVIPFIMLNRGQQRKYPRIRIGRAESVDVNILSQVADRAVRFGAKISAKKTVDQLGLAHPDSEDDVLTLPPQAQIPGLMSAKNKKPETAAAQPPVDSIDALAQEMAGEWEEIMSPIEALLQEAVKESASYEEFSTKLLQLSKEMDMGPVGEKIARAVFSARTAGNLGVKLDGDA